MNINWKLMSDQEIKSINRKKKITSTHLWRPAMAAKWSAVFSFCTLSKVHNRPHNRQHSMMLMLRYGFSGMVMTARKQSIMCLVSQSYTGFLCRRPNKTNYEFCHTYCLSILHGLLTQLPKKSVRGSTAGVRNVPIFSSKVQ